MLRNLPKVTQQRFKPGFLCDCKTVLLFVCGPWGEMPSVLRKRALASPAPDPKDAGDHRDSAERPPGWGRANLGEKTQERVQIEKRVQRVKAMWAG